MAEAVRRFRPGEVNNDGSENNHDARLLVSVLVSTQSFLSKSYHRALSMSGTGYGGGGNSAIAGSNIFGGK